MADLITFGAFVGGIWALSLLGLKSIRDSNEAEPKLKDAAGAAIVALNIIAGGAAAWVLGWNMDGLPHQGAETPESEATGGNFIGAWLAIGIFLIPFIAMGVVYKGWLRKKPHVESQD